MIFTKARLKGLIRIFFFFFCKKGLKLHSYCALHYYTPKHKVGYWSVIARQVTLGPAFSRKGVPTAVLRAKGNRTKESAYLLNKHLMNSLRRKKGQGNLTLMIISKIQLYHFSQFHFFLFYTAEWDIIIMYYKKLVTCYMWMWIVVVWMFWTVGQMFWVIIVEKILQVIMTLHCFDTVLSKIFYYEWVRTHLLQEQNSLFFLANTKMHIRINSKK